LQSSTRSKVAAPEAELAHHEATEARAADPVKTAARPLPDHPRALQIGFGLGALGLSLLVLYLMRDVIGAFVLGALLAFLIAPLVDRLAGLGLPRPVGILLVFAALPAVLVWSLPTLVPIVAEEVDQLRAQAPAMAGIAQSRLSQLEGKPLQILGFRLDLSGSTTTVEQHANEYLLGQFGNAIGIGLAALTTLLQIVLMLIVAFLLALDAHRVSRLLRSLTPTAYRQDFDDIWTDVKAMLYSYMRGQLVIAALIGSLCGLTVWLLGLKFALAMGVLAGIASLVPYLGPFLGAVPAVLVGLAASPQKALLVALAYLVISNVILNFIYPKVVGDAVKLPPLLVIIAFIAGFSMAGILGMFIAVPIAATFRILFDHIYPKLYGSPA